MNVEWKKGWQGYQAVVEGKRLLVSRVPAGGRNLGKYVYRVQINGADIPCARRVNLKDAKFHAAAHALGPCKKCA